MKRAIGYLRVSGLGQVDKDGEQRQLDSVLAFCKQNGLELIATQFEKGVSGTVEGLDRPEFRNVLDIIAREDIAWEQKRHPNAMVDFGGVEKKRNRPCIVVERMDRLARDLMVQELLLRECRERGIEVYTTDQPGLIDIASDLGDPTRKLFRQIMGALAEWEKSALVLKLRKARDRKRAETGRCEGILPFCLTPSGKYILERVQALRDQGRTVRQIVADLNENGFTTCTGKPWTKRPLLQLVQKSKGLRK